MKDIKRWNIMFSYHWAVFRDGIDIEINEETFYSDNPEGRLVFYEDHEAIVKELQAKIDELELKLLEINHQDHVNEHIKFREMIEKRNTGFTPLNNLIKCLTIIRDKAGDHKIIIENHINAYLGIAVVCPEENFKREDFETLRELNCVSVYHEHREYYESMHYYFTLYPTDSQ